VHSINPASRLSFPPKVEAEVSDVITNAIYGPHKVLGALQLVVVVAAVDVSEILVLSTEETGVDRGELT
jgi:hypothetical protein